MAAFTIAPCSVADGAALSRNNMSAFWQDQTWVLSWRHTTLEEHIATTAKRYPRRLIADRATARHEKAVDGETGRLLGYARWDLPASYATPTPDPATSTTTTTTTTTTSTATIEDSISSTTSPSSEQPADEQPQQQAEAGRVWWPEAVVPAVSAEEEAEIRRVAEAAPWHPNQDSDALDRPVTKIKKEIMARKDFLCLDYLAVHPSNQGRGVATALVRSGIKQAEEMGLDIFVLAFRSAWGVYERLGFRVESELVQDDTAYGGPGEYAVRYMIYEAGSGEKKVEI